MRASVNQGGMDTIYTYIQLRIHICVFVVIRALLRSENASVNEVGMDTINTLVPNLALFCMSLVGVASCGLSGGSGRRPNGGSSGSSVGSSGGFGGGGGPRIGGFSG